jgi:cell division protein FtsB
VRWDRKLRTVMLCVLLLVTWVGVKAFMSVMASRAQAEQQSAAVASLIRESRVLEREQRSLHERSTIVRDARALGMVRKGEQAYVVTGLTQR